MDLNKQPAVHRTAGQKFRIPESKNITVVEEYSSDDSRGS